jgi:hypothetical protein
LLEFSYFFKMGWDIEEKEVGIKREKMWSLAFEK